MSTIYALATPPGRSGLAVVRISGPDAVAAVTEMAGPLPSPRRAGLRRLRNADGVVLDEAIVLSFPEGESYTGEAVVELQCHGSPAVVGAVLSALGDRPGLRPAEPGEFSRRSLINGRMDLAQIEGLADLLDAETEAQRAQAWRIYDKEATALVERWRGTLVHALALIEAVIDFTDQDVPGDVRTEVRGLVAGVLTELDEQIAGFAAAERLRSGYVVAIVGPPNSGKSTLLNHIAGREVAITSDVPGTTRDVLEVHLNLHGLPVCLLDTAGLRDTDDEVEGLGTARARQRAATADLRVVLLDGPSLPPGLEIRQDDIILQGKSDLGRGDISGATGAGVRELLEDLRLRLANAGHDGAIFNRHRHRLALVAARGALERASAHGLPEEVMAQHLWDGLNEMGRLLGHLDIEDILDDVFASFCIGK